MALGIKLHSKSGKYTKILNEKKRITVKFSCIKGNRYDKLHEKEKKPTKTSAESESAVFRRHKQKEVTINSSQGNENLEDDIVTD